MKKITLIGAGLLMVGTVIFMIGSLGPNIGPNALTFLVIEIIGILVVGIGLLRGLFSGISQYFVF